MSALIETKDADSRLDRIRKLLARAEDNTRRYAPDDQSSEAKAARKEATACNERAADLIAKYGIDQAMLAADGSFGDEVIDKIVWIVRPFASQMADLLWNIARPLRADGRLIKTWNPESGPKAKGSVPRGGWDYGLRLFAYRSDMERIELLYTMLRNQALAGATRIVNKEEKFGQAQKADRESYLHGFRVAVWSRLDRAEREAERAAKAEQDEARDLAMLEGRGDSLGQGVVAVLDSRRMAIRNATDKAFGITQADREKWARQAQEAARAREAREQEIADCGRCQKAKSGRCIDHRDLRGRAYRTYERTGNRFHDGYEDGQRASLDSGPDQISDTEAMALEA